MNKIYKALVVVVLLLIGSQAMAQVRGALFLGAAIPQKDYAVFNNFNDFALMSNDPDDDYAGDGVGFNVGLKWYFNVGVKGLDAIVSVDGILNGANTKLKNAYRDSESSYAGPFVGGSFQYNATPKFINVPAMLGLNYMYHIHPNFGVFVEAGAGANLRFILDKETVTKGYLLGMETIVKDFQYYDQAFSFAYQAGIGIEVSKNLVVGCNFYDLGAADVKGEQTIRTTTLIDNDTRTENYYNIFGSVHPIMLLGRVAFSF